MKDFLKLESLSKNFGAQSALQALSLAVAKGEFFSILGPSGCGKTTLLRCIAGFETPDTGSIYLDGAEISRLPPERRKLNTIFQSYALFPHLNVQDNIAFGLKLAKLPAGAIKSEVSSMLTLTKLEQHATKKPAQLSGGQKQRVAIARALILKPKVLLLDEPLAALDSKLRKHMLLELERIHRTFGITFVYVTHDQEEALSVSNRVAVMNNGNFAQVGTPQEIYEQPADKYVADFIGEVNLFSNEEQTRLGLTANDKALSIRPERIQISNTTVTSSEGSGPKLRGTIEDIVYLGASQKFIINVNQVRVLVSSVVACEGNIFAHGQQVSLAWPDSAQRFLEE